MMQQPMLILFVRSDMLTAKRQEVMLELQEAASRKSAACAQGDHRLCPTGCVQQAVRTFVRTVE